MMYADALSACGMKMVGAMSGKLRLSRMAGATKEPSLMKTTAS